MEEALLSLVSFGLADPGQELPPPADALQRADLTPQASQPIPRMTWNPIELSENQREVAAPLPPAIHDGQGE